MVTDEQPAANNEKPSEIELSTPAPATRMVNRPIVLPGTEVELHDLARDVARRIEELPIDVVGSFCEGIRNPEAPTAWIWALSQEIALNMAPIVEWWSRRRDREIAQQIGTAVVDATIEAAELVEDVNREIVDGKIPDYTDDIRPAFKRMQDLKISTRNVAIRLRGWAEEIELEETQRQVALEAAKVALGKTGEPKGGGGAGAAAAKTKQRKENGGGATGEPRMTVERWSDLGIGIDEERRYLACSPCPEYAEVFPKEKAVILDLPGEQWQELFDLFARSKSGNAADKKELMSRFGYLKRGGIAAEEVSKLADDPQKMQILDTASRRLTRAMADLGRKLRKQVKGPAGRNGPRVLSVALEKEVRAAFVVRYLVRGSDGKLRFGEKHI